MPNIGERSTYHVDTAEAGADSLVKHAQAKLLYHELAPFFEDIVGRDSDRETTLVCSALELTAESSGNVLDLGCGVGRILARLAARSPGLNAVGVDLSPDVLRVARGRGLKTACVDMRFLGIRPTSTDAAICMWSTFNYLSRAEDRRVFFAGLQDALLPSGRLLIDSVWRPDGYTATDLREIRTKGLEGTISIEKVVRGSLNEARYSYDLTFLASGTRRRFTDQELCVMLTVDDIAREAQLFGFRLAEQWNSYDPEEGGSRQIALLEKDA